MHWRVRTRAQSPGTYLITLQSLPVYVTNIRASALAFAHLLSQHGYSLVYAHRHLYLFFLFFGATDIYTFVFCACLVYPRTNPKT